MKLILEVPFSKDILFNTVAEDIDGYTKLTTFMFMKNDLYHEIMSVSNLYHAEHWMRNNLGRFAKLFIIGEESDLAYVKLMLDTL